LLVVAVVAVEVELAELVAVEQAAIEQLVRLLFLLVLQLQLLWGRGVLLEVVVLVLSVAVLCLAVSLQPVAVVVAKVVMPQQLTAVLAVAVVKAWLVALVIRLAPHHHKEIMVDLL
jgi:hypothetical protein